jgi:hypothetical protein
MIRPSDSVVRRGAVAKGRDDHIDASGCHGGDAELHEVAQRIRAPVEDGRLEAQGDRSKWRHSEVRLPQGKARCAVRIEPSRPI